MKCNRFPLLLGSVQPKAGFPFKLAAAGAATGLLAWPALIPFLSFVGFGLVGAGLVHSYTWSASTVPSSGYLLVLVPLLLSHGPQLSNLGLQSASNSFFQLWCPCMGVLGLGSAVTLLETTLQSLL